MIEGHMIVLRRLSINTLINMQRPCTVDTGSMPLRNIGTTNSYTCTYSKGASVSVLLPVIK